jgi:hypothetical protein
MDTEKLLYRRQFIFAPKEINDFPTWNKYNILDKYMLYAHPDLVQSEYSEGNKRLILLGDLYDPENYEFNNMNILARLIKNNSITELIESSFKYAGRFALFFIQDGAIYVFHDSSAGRKVYYTKGTKSIWCGSKPHVIAQFAGLPKSSDKLVLDFYNSESFKSHENADVYNNTIFDSIKQLLPNFYFDFQQQRAVRYWPDKKIVKSSLQEGVALGSKILTGILKSANNRHDLMIPVTAGYDSRLLLAATREIQNDPFYYIIRHNNMTNNHHDIKIPNRLLSKLGLKFNIVDYSTKIDKEFENIYFKNDVFAYKKSLPVIYDVFYKRFPDKVNLPARFSGISRNYFDTYKKNVTAELLATIFRYKNSKLVVDSYKAWVNGIKDAAQKSGYGIPDLFNWEEYNGNFQTKIQSNKDIAQEEFTPFNCRKLMIVYLSVPEKYRNSYTNVYYTAMIKHMWPELLTEPLNPHLWKHYYATKLKLYWLFRWLKKGW